MKKTIILLLCALISVVSQGAADKKVLPSIVSVSTSDAAGKPLGKAWGVAIPSDSTAAGRVTILAPYGLFKHAVSATVTSSKGKTSHVYRIAGANDLYDVAKVTVSDCEVQPLHLATAKLGVGERAFITVVDNKKGGSVEAQIAGVEEHGGLAYYTLSLPANKAYIGLPLLNAAGEIVAVIQKNAAGEDENMFAIGVEIATALTVETMSAANPSLNSIYIPKQLPQGEKQASSYLYLLAKNSEDTISYAASLGDFIKTYPTSTFGYMQRALYYASTQQYAKAEADYDAALESCADSADVHYNMSTTLYLLNQSKSYTPYKDWTLDRALSEIDAAYRIMNTPLYLMHKGKCLYAMKKFNEAAEVYSDINKTNFRSSENLYYQSRSLQMAGGDSLQVLALLDSAVMRFSRPYKQDAAAYIYYRAQQYDRYGHYKEAVVGYQDYQDIVGINNLNDRFFYLKEQAEVKCNFYPQALNDIEQAIALNSNEYVYHIEKALIETRTGDFEEAVISAKQAQKLDPSDSDSYKLMGIAYGELGNSEAAISNLQRAVELGDSEAQSWIDSMKKTSAQSRRKSK